MKKIAIIGAAGTLGAACAMTISLQDSIDELCLIDVNEKALDNHIMDFENAFPSKLIYRGVYEDLKHSHIIIIAAGVPNRSKVTSRNAYLEDNLRIFKIIGENIAKYAPDAIIVTASNPVDILNYHLFKYYGFKRSQLIGYTLNDSLRFEWALRDVIDVNAQDELKCPVIGEHGNSQVPIFSYVLHNGQPMVVSSEQKSLIHKKLEQWFVQFNGLNIPRTTGWTTGVGIGEMVSHLLSEAPVLTTGSVVLEGEYGVEGLSMGAPIYVNSDGMHSVVEWKLNSEEEVALEQSALKIKSLIQENKDIIFSN